MERKVLASFVYNQLDPLGTRKTVEIEPGQTVREVLLKEFVPLAPSGFEVTACHNGKVVEGINLDLVLLPGDNIVMTALPRGGGGGGKNPFAAVAMLAVLVTATIVAPYIAGPLGAAWNSAVLGAGVDLLVTNATATMIVTGGLIAAGGMIVSSIFRPSMPDMNSDVNGTTPTYSWSQEPNSTQEGNALPILYGKFRITPPIAARRVYTSGDKQYLDVLCALAGHKVQSVDAYYINDQPSNYFKDVQVEYRYGDIDQATCQYFGDLYTDYAINLKFGTDYITRQIPGETVDGFTVVLRFPGGLYYFNNKGGLDPLTVKLVIESRKIGTADWIPCTEVQTQKKLVPNYRWSGGYMGIVALSGQRGWVEIEEGSTNKNEHKEGDPYTPPSGDWRYVYPRPRFEWKWVEDGQVEIEVKVNVPYITITANQIEELRKTISRDRVDPGKYELRWKFYEAPPSTTRHRSDCVVEYVQSVVYDDFTYPGVALAGVRALATDQLSGSMRLQFLVTRGTVPVYNPYLGGYEYMPSDNPAWACYDLLHNGASTNPHKEGLYGGQVEHISIDYNKFKSWADYCDSKKYKCNVYLDSVDTLRKNLDKVSQVGRGSVIQIGSKFTVIVDRKVDIPNGGFLFTLGNTGEDFNELWMDQSDRATSVEVTYYDAEADYTRQTVEVYQDNVDESDIPEKKASVTLFACTSRQMALEYARAMLLRNRYLTLTCSFSAGKDAVACLPGDVIDVSHDVLQVGYSGRLVSADASSATLDREVEMIPGIKYALEVRYVDGTRDTVPIVTPTQTTSLQTVTLLSPWSRIPETLDVYSFGEVDRLTKTFRVVSVSRDQDLRFQITALEYIPEVYDDAVYDVPDDDISDAQAVRNVIALETWVMSKDGTGHSVIDVSWSGNAFQWNVFIRKSTELAWKLYGVALTQRMRIDMPLNEGETYIVGVGTGSIPDNSDIDSVTILGKLAPPNDVTNFAVSPFKDNFVMQWDHIPDADMWGYEIRRGESWEKGLICVDGVQENRVTWKPPVSGTYNFWIKAKDLSGNYSVNAVSYISSISLTEEINVVLDNNEIPNGIPNATLKNLVRVASGLKWLPGVVDTDVPTSTDQTTGVVNYNGNYDDGVYTSQAYDLGTVVLFTLRGEAVYTALIGNITDLTYPTRTDKTYPLDTDQHITSRSSYVPEYRVSQDGNTWGAWVLWTAPVDLTARYVQVRVKTKLESTDTDFVFNQIHTTIDVPDKEVRKSNVAIPAGGLTVTHASIGIKILSQYNVGVTVLGAAAIYATVDQQADRFTIRLFNNAGTSVAGNVNYILRGF